MQLHAPDVSERDIGEKYEGLNAGDAEWFYTRYRSAALRDLAVPTALDPDFDAAMLEGYKLALQQVAMRVGRVLLDSDFDAAMLEGYKLALQQVAYCVGGRIRLRKVLTDPV